MRLLLRGRMHAGLQESARCRCPDSYALPKAHMEAAERANAMPAHGFVSMIGDAHCHAQLDPQAQQLLGMCQVHLLEGLTAGLL